MLLFTFKHGTRGGLIASVPEACVPPLLICLGPGVLCPWLPPPCLVLCSNIHMLTADLHPLCPVPCQAGGPRCRLGVCSWAHAPEAPTRRQKALACAQAASAPGSGDNPAPQFW